ncbi:flagellar hook-length control protein FliK [Sphingomonas sp. DBB INV C78]|uniref:flagellar hook-length control protein FliK n=1 Tax=Sphingomonas sp. DBB INV C78 TaxID=3349434 RepID=UPI0036D25366
MNIATIAAILTPGRPAGGTTTSEGGTGASAGTAAGTVVAGEFGGLIEIATPAPPATAASRIAPTPTPGMAVDRMPQMPAVATQPIAAEEAVMAEGEGAVVAPLPEPDPIAPPPAKPGPKQTAPTEIIVDADAAAIVPAGNVVAGAVDVAPATADETIVTVAIVDGDAEDAPAPADESDAPADAAPPVVTANVPPAPNKPVAAPIQIAANDMAAADDAPVDDASQITVDQPALAIKKAADAIPLMDMASAAPAGDAPDVLPSPLLSQALPNVAARPVGQPYPVAHHAPVEHVVTAQPGQIGREMGVAIARSVSAGKDEVMIRLDPAEMGRIDVRLSFDRDGGLRAVMAADSPAALDMLRRDAGDLTRALADAGVRADSQSLRFDSRGADAGQSGQRSWQGSDGRGNPGGQTGRGKDNGEDQPVYRQLRASGRVDLMA